jgi:integrase
MLLRDWLTEWFRNYGSSWAPKTLKDRASVTAKWITPLLGDVPVDQLGPRLIRRYRTLLLERGASNNRANAIITILSAALTSAVEDGIIDINPCRGINRLPHQKKAIRGLTPLEVEAIRYAMPEPRDKIIISLIAYAGMRPAEVCGLQWKHIREDLIIVQQSIQDAKIGPTKTRKTRTIRILPTLQSDLDDYGRGPDNSFIVTGSKGGPLNFNIWEQRVFRKYVTDEDITPYVLRHTFASLALHEGRSIPWITSEMGHASPSTLLDHYAHLYQEAELATRVPMNEAVQAARNTPPSAPQ